MIGVLTFMAGLVLLVIGAEFIVRGAIRVAAALGVRPLVLGLTVVAVGTSAPELAVGITASSQGSGALAVGNIAGTNIFNILFILGMSAFLRPLALHLRILRLELPMTLGTAGLLIVLAWDGSLSQLDGVFFIATGVLYTLVLIRKSREESTAVRAEFKDMFDAHQVSAGRPGSGLWRDGLVLLAGLAVSVAGAQLLVHGAVALARQMGVSEAVIGLTIVAVGTSAPELVTTIVSTIKNERDVAVGNLIGSSIYNILFILGITCLVSPGGVPVERQLLHVDIPLMSAVMLACVPVFATERRISRLEGGLFVTAYLAYMTTLLLVRT